MLKKSFKSTCLHTRSLFLSRRSLVAIVCLPVVLLMGIASAITPPFRRD